MEQYLESLVRPLLSLPDELRVEKTTDEKGVLLTLFINQQDLGRIIGKQGQTAHAIRRLVRQFGMLQKAFVAVKIYEPDQARRKPEYKDDVDEFQL